MANEARKDVARRESGQPIEAERVVEKAPTFAPAADVLETDSGAVLLVDLPGCHEKSVDVRVEQGVLTITGRVERENLSDHELTYCEYRTGDFERAFSVSELIDTEKIDATVRDGVLRLVLPKMEAAKPKKIPVKVG